MKPPLRDLTFGVDLERADLPEDPAEFLRMIGGPTLLRLPGRDPSRTRVVTTLLHGNEPSGLHAVHRYLRSPNLPTADALFFIASVEAALEPPGFANRALPGTRDANRVWQPPFFDEPGRVAESVLSAIFEVEPECLVDLHNNSGHNPAYGVAFSLGHAERSLVSLFADRVVHTPLELGTIVEATVDTFPSVTVECGRGGDPAADEVAWAGLLRYLEWEQIDFERPVQALAVYEDPIRVCVRKGMTLAFAEAEQHEADLTISASVDRHNFETLVAGTPIGWLAPEGEWPLEAWNAAGEECSEALFVNDDGVLRARNPRIPIMMTTNRVIAETDCLFYSVSLA